MFVRLQCTGLQILTLRKEGESGGTMKGNNIQNDVHCLQKKIIKMVIPRDNFNFLRNFYLIFGCI